VVKRERDDDVVFLTNLLLDSFKNDTTPINRPTIKQYDLLSGDFIDSMKRNAQPVHSGKFKQYQNMNMFEYDKSYSVEIELPGVKKEDVSVIYSDGVLVLKCSFKSDMKDVKKVIFKNRFFGDIIRYINVPEDVDVAKISSSLEEGILKITLFKKDIKASVNKTIVIDVV
jgi:HSP20 family protein